MRLLNTQKLTFQEFFDESRPPYAILSHRWGGHELSYKQYIDNSFTKGPAIEKIRNAAREAQRRSLDWLWVDTICIDKASSAELSEAINSMWSWYMNATVCLAFLADVKYDTPDKKADAFRQSEWFHRGWTLQELLASRHLEFFDSKWLPIATNSTEQSLSHAYFSVASDRVVDHVSHVTGIPIDFLTRKRAITEASVAMRMSWAANRVTTRLEDQAYCLLGLFGVNMPLLYGEGKNAFFRLQLEILRNSDDESIFAWRAGGEMRGLLAESPREFSDSGNIHKMDLAPEHRLPWAWTNKGLELRILDRAAKDNIDPMPPGNWQESVYLGCYIQGPSTHPEDKPSFALQNMQSGRDRDSYVFLMIRRFGNAWYRTQCGGLYLDTGFQSMSRFGKHPLVYKYYYVPRYPSQESRDAFEKERQAEVQRQQH